MTTTKCKKKTMTATIEEGFKSEQQGRQLAQSEIMKGLKDEENARQMVQKDPEGEAEAQCAARQALEWVWDWNFIGDLQKMVLDQLHKYLDLDQTRTEQGTWPTETLWFKNETNMSTMIVILEIVKHELKKVLCKLHGQEVSVRLELSEQKALGKGR